MILEYNEQDFKHEADEWASLDKFFPETKPLTPNLDTSTEEGRAWRQHMLEKPLREWKDRQSISNRDPYWDNRD